MPRFSLTCFGIISFVFGLASCASAPLTLNDNVIVPGERVGDVEIGMTLDQLIALKGLPRKTMPIANTEASTYFYDGLTVAADNKVYWIIAKDDQYRTTSGVAPGVEQIFALASLGKPDCVVTKGDLTIYDFGNLYFDIENANGQVRRIGVMRDTLTCDG